MHLSVADKAAIKQSFSQLTQNESNIAESFYNNLFNMAPLIKPLFKSDRDILEIHFNELFRTAVHKIDHFQELRKDLLALGARHKSYQAKMSHFDVVKSALLLSIEYELKGQSNDTIMNAWKQYIENISDVMIEGFDQPQN